MDMPELDSRYADDHKQIIVSGVLGGVHPLGVRCTIYSESTDSTNTLKAQPLATNRAVVRRTAECDLVIDPMQMKSIHMWLGQQIREYERLWGRIPSPEEIQHKMDQRDPR